MGLHDIFKSNIKKQAKILIFCQIITLGVVFADNITITNNSTYDLELYLQAKNILLTKAPPNEIKASSKLTVDYNKDGLLYPQIVIRLGNGLEPQPWIIVVFKENYQYIKNCNLPYKCQINKNSAVISHS